LIVHINGCIERFIGTRKKVNSSRLNQQPAEFTNYVYPLTHGACKLYTSKKSKKRKPPKDNENEQAPGEAVDKFKPTTSTREPLVIRTLNSVGHHQSNVVFPVSGISKDLIKKIETASNRRETRAKKHTNIS